MENITKTFPGVIALDDVSIDLHKGEVLGILGENGAGKSTLIKILAGNYIKDSGHIYIDGKEFDIKSPAEAMASGIRVIYQELNTIDNLTVTESIFVGEQVVKGPLKIVDWKAMTEQAKKLLDTLNVRLDPNAIIGDLSVSEKQVVEIAKAISKEAKILVMDEPTAALSEEEINSLFNIISLNPHLLTCLEMMTSSRISPFTDSWPPIALYTSFLNNINCPIAVLKSGFLVFLISDRGINPIIIKLPNGTIILSCMVTIICLAKIDSASTLYFKRQATEEAIEVGK